MPGAGNHAVFDSPGRQIPARVRTGVVEDKDARRIRHPEDGELPPGKLDERAFVQAAGIQPHETMIGPIVLTLRLRRIRRHSPFTSEQPFRSSL